MKQTQKYLKQVGAVVALASLIALAGCSGSSGSGGTKDSSGDGGSFEGRGPITYVQGKDNAGKLQALMDQWNEKHPDEKVTMIELSTEADQQRQSMVNNAQTKSDAYCVLSVDNIYVPEFAAHRWIDELPADEFAVDKFLKPVWETGQYLGKTYAIPHSSDGGLLYYRKDILAKAGITTVPATWEDMIKAWEAVKALPEYATIGGYAGQFFKYEGLTVNASEVINSQGGKFLDDSGKVAIDTPEAAAGLKFLVDGFASGFIPKEALTYKEEEGRAAFEAGRIIFYRNWPYQYSLNEKAIGADAFGVTSLPTLAGKPLASTLGGHNVAISSFCKNKATALDFMKWYSDAEAQKYTLKEESLAPVYGEIYDDAEMTKLYPYLPALKASIENAQPRPRAVKYGDFSAAIQDAVTPVLQGEATPEEALATMQKSLEAIVSKG
ncbi:MAG: ABC transporter substrate-binding protein [Actinomycetaceae bacterium]|nr:ABC transporter substrate-binding protein [Actinomycetaceae bacterium]